MEITKILNVTAKQFYNLIIDSISVETEKLAKAKPYQGLKYKKTTLTKLKTPIEVEVEINELIENQKYTYTMIGTKYYTKASYEINDQGENCKITYIEIFHSDDNKLTLNQKIMTTLTGFTMKRKMTKKLKAMEQYILKNKPD